LVLLLLLVVLVLVRQIFLVQMQLWGVAEVDLVVEEAVVM
jgi:hypothetical protein